MTPLHDLRIGYQLREEVRSRLGALAVEFEQLKQAQDTPPVAQLADRMATGRLASPVTWRPWLLNGDR
jgi:hypothetical protein